MLLTAGLIAAPASVALQGVDALDLPLAALTRKLSWETGLETSYGLTAIAAAFALFAGLFACLAESSRLARGLALARPPRRGARAFAQRPRQHGTAAARSAARRCSCMPCAWRSGSGRCCRSLWARVTRPCAPRRPPSASSGASPTRSCRWSCCWCSPACGSPSFSSIASMPCGRRTMVGYSRASLPRSSCCSRSPRPTGTGWCRSSKAPAARRRGRSRSRSRSSLSSRW